MSKKYIYKKIKKIFIPDTKTRESYYRLSLREIRDGITLRVHTMRCSHKQAGH